MVASFGSFVNSNIWVTVDLLTVRKLKLSLQEPEARFSKDLNDILHRVRVKDFSNEMVAQRIANQF